MNIKCKLFGHKYIKQVLDVYAFQFVCERCGKLRDVYGEGKPRNTKIKYYCKGDGKKDVK